MMPRLYVGTAGLSVWYSDDLGETLHVSGARRACTRRRACGRLPAIPNGRVNCWPAPIAASTGSISRPANGPTCPRRWTTCASGRSRARRTIPTSSSPVRARPASSVRPTERKPGSAWKAPLPETCPAVMKPRVTRITFDPDDPDLVFAGLEIGGVWRSTDGGKSFENASAGPRLRGHPRRRGGAQRLSPPLRHHQHGSARQQGRRPIVGRFKPLQLRLAIHARGDAARRPHGLHAAW